MIIRSVGLCGSVRTDGTDGWTDGQRDMRKLIVASLNFPTTPVKQVLFFFIGVELKPVLADYLPQNR